MPAGREAPADPCTKGANRRGSKLGLDADASVLDAEARAVAVALQARGDSPSRRGEFQCVRQKIHGDLTHACGVRVHPQARLERALEVQP